jgi:hypothetical protein
VVNNILDWVNSQVTNPQIERTEDTSIISITLGRTRFTLNCVLYKVLDTDDHGNVQGVTVHSTAARGQLFPQHTSMEIICVASMPSLGADDDRHALGPSRALGQAPNAQLSQ